MKFLRRFLLFLAALGLLIALVALDPWAQTQIAQSWLNRQPGFRGTVESVSARWAQVAFTDLRLKFEGATLIVPSVTVGVPVKECLLRGRFPVRHLVAKGWTLDLDSPAPPAAVTKPVAPGMSGSLAPTLQTASPAEPVPRSVFLAQQLGLALHELLNAAGGEREVSWDGVDLEGDVRLPTPKGGDALWFQVKLVGGGLAAAREGVFTLQISELNAPSNSVPLTVRVLVRMDATRAFDRIRIESQPPAGTPVRDANRFALALEATTARRVGDETYTLEARHLDRTVLQLRTQRHTVSGDFAGTWKLDARDEDRVALARFPATLSLVANGGGAFTADARFSRFHLAGDAAALVSDRGSAFSQLGTVSAAGHFDLTLQGTLLRVNQLEARVTGAAPLATFTLRQPVEYDTRNQQLSVADSKSDWLQATLQGLPLAIVPALPPPWRVSGGAVTGELTVSGTAGTVAVRTTTPLAATGVAITRDGQLWGEDLDVSLGLDAKWTAGTWQMEWSPLTFTHAGETIASSTGRIVPATSANRPATLKGTVEVALDMVGRQPIGREIGHLPGRSLTAEFSTQVGAWNTLTAKINVVGRVPTRTASATLTADLDRNGRLTFLAPLKIAFGKTVSDLTAEGTWTTGPTPRFGVKLSGGYVESEHLRPLAGPAAWLVGSSGGSAARMPAFSAAPMPPTATPFWGGVPGWITLMIEKLRASGRDYEDVGGTLTLDPKALRLEGGHARQQPYNPVKIEGTLAFDGTAAAPYQLNATAALAGLDTAELLPMPTPAQPLVWEGKYAATVVTTSSGRNLDDLWRRRGDEFRLSANSGILRLLGTQIADGIPRLESKSKERMSAVAETLGKIFKGGRSEDDIGAIPSAITRQAENVLNFTYRIREFAFTKLEVAAFRTADGTIHLNEILIQSDQEHLTGTGRIDGGEGLISTHPLRLDLRLALRNATAEGIADTGLLSDEKNSQGYTRLAAPISLGGTLSQIDESTWRESLLRAAVRASTPASDTTKVAPVSDRKKSERVR